MKPNKVLRNYNSPEVTRIPLDNEISLILESPPPDPWADSLQENHKNDPFKTDLA